MKDTEKFFTFSRALLLLVLLALPLVEGVAQEITIVDSAGIPRATTNVNGSGNLLFVLEDANGNLAENASVQLMDVNTKEILDIGVEQGKAIFCGVPSGVWQVTSDVDWATFTDIKVETIDDSGGLGLDCAPLPPAVIYAGGTVGAVLGGTAIAGATTAGVVGYQNSRSSKSGAKLPLSPSR